jgi:segregation and condensation protein A
MSSSSSSTPEPLDPKFQLKLPTFEGPLDLLLHLCQKHELDILDLPIAFVTERYLEYVRVMERLDLDIASEYLVMAATLAHIKSKMLLPPDPTAEQDEIDPEEEIDPRQELIRRLLEYQKYKAAGEELGARGVQGRDVFLRGMEAPEATGPAPLAGMGLFKLLDAFQAVLKRAKQDLAFEITAEGVTIQDRMSQLAERLRTQRRCTFDELFDDARTVYDVVVTFLALLEMAKRRLARVYQSEPTAPIHLEYRVLDADEDPAGGPDDAPPEPAPETVAAVVDAVLGPEREDADVDEVAPAVADESERSEATPPLDPSETLAPDRETEPGVALEGDLEPPPDAAALETDVAPEVHEALEAEIEPADALPIDAPASDEPALDLGERVAQDSPPADADDERDESES